jgi:disulfide bond formation protein DsbB
MYPLALILLIAAWRRDVSVRLYAMPLSGLGLIVSVYHYLVQTFPSLEVSNSCGLDGGCAAKFVNEYGFMSIPLMAGCGFLAIITCTAIARSKDET